MVRIIAMSGRGEEEVDQVKEALSVVRRCCAAASKASASRGGLKLISGLVYEEARASLIM